MVAVVVVVVTVVAVVDDVGMAAPALEDLSFLGRLALAALSCWTALSLYTTKATNTTTRRPATRNTSVGNEMVAPPYRAPPSSSIVIGI